MAVAPADSLSILTTLFGAAVILMVLALALVTALICQDNRNSASPPAGDVLVEPAVDGRGLIVIAAIVLAGILAAGQVVHWAVS